jgi:hypothetical protein
MDSDCCFCDSSSAFSLSIRSRRCTSSLSVRAQFNPVLATSRAFCHFRENNSFVIATSDEKISASVSSRGSLRSTTSAHERLRVTSPAAVVTTRYYRKHVARHSRTRTSDGVNLLTPVHPCLECRVPLKVSSARSVRMCQNHLCSMQHIEREIQHLR